MLTFILLLDRTEFDTYIDTKQVLIGGFKMNLIAAQEIKRRGIGAVDEALAKGPVHVIRNNRPRYVVLSAQEYEAMLMDIAEARLASSEADLQANRITRGTAADIMAALREDS